MRETHDRTRSEIASPRCVRHDRPDSALGRVAMPRVSEYHESPAQMNRRRQSRLSAAVHSPHLRVTGPRLTQPA